MARTHSAGRMKKPASDFSVADFSKFLRWWAYVSDLPDVSNRLVKPPVRSTVSKAAEYFQIDKVMDEDANGDTARNPKRSS